MTHGKTGCTRSFALVSGLLVWATVSARPGVAHGDVHLSAEIAGSLLIAEYTRETERWEADPGLATALSAGWEWKAGLWSFVPEVGFGGGVFDDPYGRRVFSLAGGVRIEWGRAFRPYVLHHVGWGMEEGLDGDAALEHRGLAIDAALGLEVPFDEHWSMAAQLTYRVLLASTGSGTEPKHWPGAGIVFALRP